MIWLNEDRVPVGHWPFLMFAVPDGLSLIEDSLDDEIDLKEGSPDILITGCLRAYRTAVMRRVLDLAQATALSWNESQRTGAIGCGRALLETIANYHCFLNQTISATKSKDWQKVGRIVDAYAFSTMKGSGKKNKSC